MSRIAALPRRTPLADADTLVREMTAWLRTPAGTMTLRPIQACTLYEAALQRGVFCSARTSAGKTLAAGLLPRVVGAQRPLLIVPAALTSSSPKVEGKTEREFRELRAHWQIPLSYRITSYQKVSTRPKCRIHGKTPCQCARPDLLEEYRPDWIVCDEAHRLKHVRSAACARRVARYVHAHPECGVATFTATPLRAGLLDYAHLLWWSLRSGAPVPDDPDLLEQWAALLDENDGNAFEGFQSLDYSILVPHLGPVYDGPTARKAFRSRLVETPGVIVSQDRFDGVSLTIEPVRLPPRRDLDDAWQRLRELWVSPIDDWLLLDKQLGVAAVAKRIALGFDYYHDPRPPTDWIEARKEWQGFVRRVLEASPTYDTMAQVRDACLAGVLPRHAWDRWAGIKDSYEARKHRQTQWLHADAIQLASRWGRDGGIIWVDHIEFGRALAEATGWPYFHEKGCDPRGRSIGWVSHQERTVIASSAACSEGHNLQPHDGMPGWSRNLFCTPPKTALDWEQRVSRTHRDGQTRDVTVQYIVGCLENFVALPCAVSYALRTEESLGQFQKLLQADRTEPPLEWAQGPAYGI